MHAAGSVGPSAVAESDLPPLEVAEELVPFGVAGNAVFLAGAGGAAAGDERPVGVDDFFGVDRLVSHRDVDVGVPGHELGDVRGHAVHQTGREQYSNHAEYLSRSGQPEGYSLGW